MNQKPVGYTVDAPVSAMPPTVPCRNAPVKMCIKVIDFFENKHYYIP
jgi:hypothetical protein